MKTAILSLFTLCLFWAGCRFADKETYLIPNSYIGNIYIFGNIKSGSAENYINSHSRLYDIPKQGILLTRFKASYGIINKKFYYKVAGENLELEPIDYQDEKGNLDPKKVYAFYGLGFTTNFPKTADTIHTEVITICKPKDYGKFSDDPFLKRISNINYSTTDISYGKLLQLKSRDAARK